MDGTKYTLNQMNLRSLTNQCATNSVKFEVHARVWLFRVAIETNIGIVTKKRFFFWI